MPISRWMGIFDVALKLVIKHLSAQTHVHIEVTKAAKPKDSLMLPKMSDDTQTIHRERAPHSSPESGY